MTKRILFAILPALSLAGTKTSADAASQHKVSALNAGAHAPVEALSRYSVVLEIENIEGLRRAYGDMFAQALEREVGERLELRLGAHTQVLPNGRGLFLIPLPATHAYAYTDMQHMGAFLDELLTTLGHGTGCTSEGGLGLGALAVFSAKWRDLRLAAPVGSGPQLTALRIPASQPSLDLRMAEEVMHALEEDRVHLGWHAVYAFDEHAPSHRGELLYAQCQPYLVRSAELEDAPLTAASFMPSLQRIRLARSLDTYVVQHMLELLRAHPTLRLGYELSASSLPVSEAADAADWEAIFTELADEPSVAARVVIEIAESASVAAEAGRRFVNRLQGLGCCIALVAYGVRYGAQAHIAIPHPDMIKLDRALLARAQRDASEAARVRGLIALAQQAAPAVAVDGLPTLQGNG